MSRSLTHISNSLNSLEDRLSTLEADASDANGLIRSIADTLYSMNLKLDAIEGMQSKHGSQLDHASAFARRSIGMTLDQIHEVRESIACEVARMTESVLDGIETVGADLHEYARQAADELEVYEQAADQEIDWSIIDRSERV